MGFRSEMWGCVEFVVAGWSKVIFFWLSNLKLGQGMRNPAYGYQ